MRSKISFFVLTVSLASVALFISSCNVRGFKEKPYPTPRVTIGTPGGVQAQDVTLSYGIIEVDGSAADIILQYSTDGGATWQPATAKGGDGTTGLRGGPFPGIPHTIIWDSFADGITGAQTCRVKITATKSGSGIVGTPGETRDFQVQNPDFPVISWIARPEGAVRQVPLTFTWRLDTPAIPIADYYYGLDEDPPTSTTAITSVTIPAPSLGPHTFRVFAQSAAGLNSSVLTAAFICDNAAANLPPTVQVTGGPAGTTLDNTPTFDYIGGDADGIVAGYFVSIDVNPPTTWTTLTTWTSAELSYSPHTFYVMAQDNEGANSSVASRAFTVTLNQAPTVQILSGPTGNTSEQQPTFTYLGSDSDGTVTGYYVSFDDPAPSIWRTSTSYAPPAPLPEGPHTFYVQARDNDDGLSTVAQRAFYVDLSMGITIYVHGTTGCDSNTGLSWAEAVKTIQRGVNISSDGYLILIADGIYQGAGNVDIRTNGRAVTIKSQNGPANCIVDGGNSVRGFQIKDGEQNTTVIDGLTVRNGYTLGGLGGGMYIWGSNPTIKNMVFKDNQATAGGGVGVESASPHISSCIFDSNNCNTGGGGVYCQNSNGTIKDCLFQNNNTMGQGGGIRYQLSTNASLINCILRKNTAGEGGGLHTNNGTAARILNCLIYSNRANHGGGVSIAMWNDPRFYNCVIENNSATIDGGAFWFDDYYTGCSVQIFNTIIWNNTAPSAPGIRLWSNTLEIYSCDFDNAADWITGGGAKTIIDCIFLDPLFQDQSANDYRLTLSSPCIDAGNNSYVDADITYDYLYNPRIVDGVAPWDGAKVDIGAYEYQP